MKIFGLTITKDKHIKSDGKNHSVLCINDKATTYSDRWGISDKRKEELDSLIKTSMIINKTDVEAIENISVACRHTNELAYITMSVIKENSGNPLSRLFRSMLHNDEL